MTPSQNINHDEPSSTTGSFNIQKFLKFLKSFWGLLAAFTTILPTIIYVLKSTQLKESVLSDYYVGVPTTFALLTIPFSFLFEDSLSKPLVVKKISSWFFIMSFITIFAFITTKSIYIVNKVYSVYDANGFKKMDIEESKRGEIALRTYYYDAGASPKSTSSRTPQVEQRVNVYELISLIMYTTSIVLLTASFSSLGVFFYTKNTD